MNLRAPRAPTLSPSNLPGLENIIPILSELPVLESIILVSSISTNRASACLPHVAIPAFYAILCMMPWRQINCATQSIRSGRLTSPSVSSSENATRTLWCLRINAAFVAIRVRASAWHAWHNDGMVHSKQVLSCPMYRHHFRHKHLSSHSHKRSSDQPSLPPPDRN